MMDRQGIATAVLSIAFWSGLFADADDVAAARRLTVLPAGLRVPVSTPVVGGRYCHSTGLEAKQEWPASCVHAWPGRLDSPPQGGRSGVAGYGGQLLTLC